MLFEIEYAEINPDSYTESKRKYINNDSINAYMCSHRYHRIRKVVKFLFLYGM